jgi:hypothetical protein
MSIPEISRTNVLAAIERVQGEGVPRTRQSTRYYLVHEGQRFPPKYTVSLAVQDATGQELDPQEFSGGVETNSLLRRLGFSVVAFSRNAADKADTPRQRATPRLSKKIVNGNAELGPPSPETAQEIPLIGRVVVRGQPGDPADGEAMLLDVLTNRWRRGLHIKFLITPGGFVTASFPSTWSGGVSWDSGPSDLNRLRAHAEKALSRTVSRRVIRAAKGKIDILTIGVDLASDEPQEHAELVAVCDLASGDVFWTGKSYPTSSQERHLVQVVDLGTHLMEIAGERVIVLGCHDLNMFSPRGRANQVRGSVRWQRCQAMRQLTRDFKPTIVLQHPHSTDSPNIWRTAWSGLVRELGGLKAWASGIAYFSWEGPSRGSLDKVLAATQGGTPTVDFVTERDDAP